MYFLSENYSVFGSFIIVAAFMNAQVPQFPSVKTVFTARKGFSVFLSAVRRLVTPFCRCQLFKQEEWMKEGRTRHSFFISRSYRRETPLM
jgi:hypothetical protein